MIDEGEEQVLGLSDHETRRDWRIAGALSLLAAILTLWGLGDCLLWDDEAQTALVSRMVAQHGIPLGFDDRHHFSQEAGAEFGEGHVWRWHTWLSFYLLAGFFLVFGESTFVARLPFALCGVACVPAVYWMARTLWNDRKTAIAAALALALMVPFLLLSRQCRYYSLCALFTTTAVIGYERLMQERRWGATLLLASIVLLFQSFFIYLPTTVLALVLHALIWHRRRLRPLALTLGLAIVICLPWIVWLSGTTFKKPDADQGEIGYFLNLLGFVEKLNRHVTSVYLLALGTVLAVIPYTGRRRGSLPDEDSRRCASLLSIFIAVSVLVLTFAGGYPFFRYLVPLLPLFAALVGRLIVVAFRRHWSWGVLAIVLYAYPQPYADYAYELTHHFRGPVNGFVEFLNRNGTPDQTVLITYGDLPLKFYTPLRVSSSFAADDLTNPPAPEWIIIREHFMVRFEIGGRAAIEQALRNHRYERIELDYPDTRWQNREDPDIHWYRSIEDEKRIAIWKRVSPPPGSDGAR